MSVPSPPPHSQTVPLVYYYPCVCLPVWAFLVVRAPLLSGKGPDRTSGFAPGWTIRQSKYVTPAVGEVTEPDEATIEDEAVVAHEETEQNDKGTSPTDEHE